MDPPGTPDRLRALPSVDRVLHSRELREVRSAYAHEPLVRAIRAILDECRRDVVEGGVPPSLLDITDRVLQRTAERWRARPARVLNATGVVLHTNLGRAPLSSDALRAMTEASGYVDLEIDLDSGERGMRQAGLTEMLQDLTGAPAAFVVVNNAAAVTLTLAALARRRDVIVSRGQAVEIGGGFRVPSIMRQSGARLVEVGTTNRTRRRDYEEAMSGTTAAILHVHSSNFKIVGFAEEVPLGELARLARRQGCLLVSDNGSGALVDTGQFGLAHEPTPLDALEAGADVVCFSGDKLLGGPQSGIILGTADAVHRISRHPLARAMRVDKVALAGLSATLHCYLRGRFMDLPVWRMIAWTATDLETRATRWWQKARARGLEVTLGPGESTVGGGSLPTETLPTTLIALPQTVRGRRLRQLTPPILARTRGNRIVLDLRTIDPTDDPLLLDLVCRAATGA